MTLLPRGRGVPTRLEAAAPAERAAGGNGRALRWLLGLQVVIALLMMGGDLLRVAPELLSGLPAAPSIDAPVSPGDQTRRFAPRLLPRDAPAGPGFPVDGPVPARLTWEETTIGGEAVLLLTGEIRPGDDARFAAYVDALETPPAVVALHSPGGSVMDALAIGRRLRAEGVATRLGPGAACFSACPYVLAGGVERTVDRTALVGLHQHFFGHGAVVPAFLAVEDIQRGQAEVMAYLEEMGVSPLLMIQAMRTPPDEIYVLVEAELDRFELATAFAD